MQTTSRMLIALAAVAALAAACETTYEFDDVQIGDDDSAKTPRDRSNSQFLRSVYADLLGRTPEVYDFVIEFDGVEANRFPINESDFLMGALDAVGDPTPMRNLIVAGLVRSAEAAIPDKDDIDDPADYIRTQFRAFLGRDPNEYELRTFVDEWDTDDAVNPRTVVRALIASREYQSL